MKKKNIGIIIIILGLCASLFVTSVGKRALAAVCQIVGDINCDGEVNAIDISIVLRHFGDKVQISPITTPTPPIDSNQLSIKITPLSNGYLIDWDPATSNETYIVYKNTVSPSNPQGYYQLGNTIANTEESQYLFSDASREIANQDMHTVFTVLYKQGDVITHEKRVGIVNYKLVTDKNVFIGHIFKDVPYTSVSEFMKYAGMQKGELMQWNAQAQLFRFAAYSVSTSPMVSGDNFSITARDSILLRPRKSDGTTANPTTIMLMGELEDTAPAVQMYKGYNLISTHPALRVKTAFELGALLQNHVTKVIEATEGFTGNTAVYSGTVWSGVNFPLSVAGANFVHSTDNWNWQP